MRRAPRRALVLAAAAALGLGATAARAAAQAPPPDDDWRTLRTEHFRVTFQPGLEPLARRAADVAERAYGLLSRELADPPDGMIDLVVTDHVDYTNGYATAFPSNRIVVFARPPAAVPEFYPRDWMELIVVHELVHIFHLDQSGAVGRAVRTLFGRVPVPWPIFSVGSTPTWSIEGLATHYESRLTGAGRVEASIHDMIIRTAALEDGIPDLDDLSAPRPVWPGGNRSYVYGARLMRWVAEQHGDGAHRAIIDATSRSLLPTFFFFDHVTKRGTDRTFDDIYDDWRAAAADSARAVAERVRARGLTPTEPVAGRGPYATGPRVSPDGRSLTYAAADFRSDPATRLVDLATGDVRRLAERNQFGSILDPAAWLPDGSGLIVGQLEMQGPYRTYSDLWRLGLDGRERRLTRGERLAQPDVAPDGRIAAVQQHNGALRLVVHDPDAGDTRVVAEAAPGDAFDRPRWSPDGRRIAVGRHLGGRTNIVLVDAATGAVMAITDDEAFDATPAWSPDGRTLLWWSDRTGIPNIMAAAVDADGRAGPVRQVTNVLTGVTDPDVSPDGRTLYVAAYHYDGWQIEALPYRPTEWRDAPANQRRYAEAALPPPSSGSDGQAGAPEPEPYSPLPTLRPYYWAPTASLVTAADTLLFLGARVHGHDMLRRHEWRLRLAREVGSGQVEGAVHWTYQGLGDPVIAGAVSRDWVTVGTLATSGGEELILRRDDEATAQAVFRRPRWRTSGRLAVIGHVQRQAYEARTLSAAELADEGYALRDLPTLTALAISPSYQSAGAYPYSISAEDGVIASGSLVRWWDIENGGRAFDEASGRASWYPSAPLWGFADHVLKLETTGFVRAGDQARLRNIGGVATTDDLAVGTDFGASNPVRGFDAGARRGTRGWTGTAEWRFPIHLAHAHEERRFLGFSLVALSGAVFGDAGDAWCTDADLARDELLGLCSVEAQGGLVSAGAELNLTFGIYHNARSRLVAGVARRLRGPPGAGPVFYLAAGF